MKRLVLAGLAGMVACAGAQVETFYGGDGDGRGMLSSEKNGTITGGSWVFDDFYNPGAGASVVLWGNFLVNYPWAYKVRYEIRSGLSAGHGGKLEAFGELSNPTYTITGRSYFGYTERCIKGSVNAHLPAPGYYWLGLSVEQTAPGRAFLSTTSGTDLGPTYDPNPAPTGKPLKNGNSFFHSEHFGQRFVPTNDPNVLGAGTWDFSYGVVGPPEPTSLALLAVGASALNRWH